MYMRSRRLPTIMTSLIMTACCGVTGVCGKSIGNGVNIFVHFFSTPISILNLAMSSEGQENDVSNDILSERKYSQLFTHESNTFLLNQLYRANRFTNAVQRYQHSLFMGCSQTDGRKRNENMISASFTAFTWGYNQHQLEASLSPHSTDWLALACAYEGYHVNHWLVYQIL